jgi:hypothetical protein
VGKDGLSGLVLGLPVPVYSRCSGGRPGQRLDAIRMDGFCQVAGEAKETYVRPARIG